MEVKIYLYRTLAHFVFRIRSYGNKSIKIFAKEIHNKKILELGSGKKQRGKYVYSVKQFFDDSNDFTQSDIAKDFGHKIIDVTDMNFNNEFDVIICMNVLEHVFDFQKAILNIHQSLKKNGVAIFFVPMVYPLHDEPNDFWRFTEHSLRKILTRFSKIEIKHSGIRQFSFAYFIKAYK